MSYLEEMRAKLLARDYAGFLLLWEEYYHGETIDPQEFVQILQAVRQSEFSPLFDKEMPHALDMWKKITDEEDSYNVFRALLDVQTSNALELADIALGMLQKRYGSLPDFQEKLRLVGLRGKENFRGAISHFELLNHMGKSRYVFHNGGWGTGEIQEVSFLRESLVLEFERVAGKKDLSFENAFKNLTPLPDEHFLSRRFGNPDDLEKEAKENPIAVIRLLLKDLGPKTAAEMKDELCELVIPEEEWTKWWQNARAKIKKDTLIHPPSSLKEPFKLRKQEVTHEERFLKILAEKKDLLAVIEFLYSCTKDFPKLLKSPSFIEKARQSLENFQHEASDEHQRLQTLFLKRELGDTEAEPQIAALIKASAFPAALVESLEIVAYKRKTLELLRQHLPHWQEIFLKLVFATSLPSLREYLLKELHRHHGQQLKEGLEQILQQPQNAPEFLVWYFQKANCDQNMPFSDAEGKKQLLEAFFTLLPKIENDSFYRDLVKKMHHILSHKRFEVVRKIFSGASVAYLNEILLLVSKCRSLQDHDMKIMHSLAEVVQPSLAKANRNPTAHEEIIWTTLEGYKKIQSRIQQIGTVETVENAREIEAARALGDLRENSEYKFALERRERLQSELKLLSSQLQKARILSQQDIPSGEVGVGTKVKLVNAQNHPVQYTLLGPWDADPEQSILSFQSKFAQAMMGKKVGELFSFQNEVYTIVEIDSYLKD